jgi:biopolymer transport protein ExbB
MRPLLPLLLLAATGATAQDRAELDRTPIVGNRELPKVLYIVPWKKPAARPLSGAAGHAAACSTRRWRRSTARCSAASCATAPRREPPPPPPRGENPMSAFDTVREVLPGLRPLFIYPSLTIMALGLAIAIERWLFLLPCAQRQPPALGPDASRCWKPAASRTWPSVAAAERSDAAMGKIVHNGLSRMQSARRREDIDAAMEEGMMEIVPRLEKRTHYIATFANVITLVGLLGTIIGLIKGFTAVAQVNPAEKAELLSASISIAMNNTAFALMVAIPFLLIHAFLQARTSRDRRLAGGRAISFLNLVQRIAPPQPGS